MGRKRNLPAAQPAPGLSAAPIDRVLLGLVLATGAAAALHCLVSVDLWWQLAAGRWIGQHGIPDLDPFSYAAGERAWIELRWLYCLAVAKVHAWLGLNGLVGVQIVGALLVLLAVCRTAPRAPAGAAAAGAAIALIAAHSRLTLRPEVVSLICVAALLGLLYRFRRDGRWQWLIPLPLLQIVWTNSHTTFVLGPAFLAVFIAGEAMAMLIPALRRSGRTLAPRQLLPLASAAALVAAACWVNPYGTAGALFPAQLFRQIQSSHPLSQMVGEFLSPFAYYGVSPLFWRYPLAAALSVWALWVGRRQLLPGFVAVWAAAAYLSTLAERNVALFGVVAGSVAVAHLTAAGWPPRTVSRLALVGRLAAAALALIALGALVTDSYWKRIDPSRRFGFGVAQNRFPLRSIVLLDREAPDTRLLTQWDDASSVLFLRGERSVLADGRLEVYGPDAILEVDRVLRTAAGFEALRDQYDIGAVLIRFGRDAGLLRRLLRDSAWAPIDFTPAHVLFVRTDQLPPERLAELRIDWDRPRAPVVELPRELEPPRWLAGNRDDGVAAAGRGELGILVGNLELARAELEAAHAARPHDADVALKLGALCRIFGMNVRADVLLAQAGGGAEQIRGPLAASRAFEEAGSLEIALAARERLLSGGTDLPEAEAGRIVELARVTNRLDGAESAFAAWTARTESPAVWIAWGQLALERDDASAAAERFQRALTADPRQPAGWLGLALARERQGELGAALQAAERSLALQPGLAAAQALRARLAPQLSTRR